MQGFNISTIELIKLVDCVNDVVPTKSVLQSIQYICLQLKDSKLTLFGTDITNSIKMDLDVEGEGEFICLLQHKVILSTLKLLANQTINCNYVDSKFVITSKEGVYKLNARMVDDYPLGLFDNIDLIQRISLDPILLKDIFNKTLFCISKDELKPALTGLYLSINTTCIEFATTDAHRLASFKLNGEFDEYKETSMIIPKKILDSCLKYINKDIFVNLYHSKNKVVFVIGNITFISSLIEMRFPEYNNVIPKEITNKIIINKKKVVDSIKRINSFSTKDNKVADFIFEDNILTISYENEEKGEVNEKIAIEFNQEPIEVRFNFEYMSEIISKITDNDFIIEIKDDKSACIIREPEDANNTKALFLLMPNMKIQK